MLKRSRNAKIIQVAVIIVVLTMTISRAICIHASSVETWDPTLGWDFENHTHSHPYLTTLDNAQIRSELEQANAAFTAHGYPPPQHLAYPYGDYNFRVETVVSEYAKTGRTVLEGTRELVTRYPVTNWYEITAVLMTSSTSWGEITEWIDTCIADKALLVIYTHSVSSIPRTGGTTPAMIAQLLDYLVQKQNAGQLTVMTIAQAYDYWSTATEGKATVVLAFDDGYESDYTEVYPLFTSRGLKGTSYIITSYIGQSGWLTWDEISTMRSGIVNVDSAFVSDDIPSSMTAGQQYTVHVTFRNTGTNTWTASEDYKLGNPQDSDPFAPARIHMDASASVSNGQSYTFTFTMTAPSAGSYVTDWRMLREGVTWFGATCSKTVTVTSS